ncbi:MAG: PDZ domain-containing protein [Lewinellaceae bacterium]|nr:PDZ domain-containing protein [Lewinellaceae bacterium]
MVSCNDNRAFLGVEEDSDEDSDAPGIVVQIVRGAAAEKAGLRTNDLIQKLNGTDVNQWSDLTAVLKEAKPGDQMTIVYSRNGKTNTTNAQLTKRSEVKCDPEDCVRGFLGISPGDDDDDDDTPGVKVDVVDGSSAEKAGLQDDDVLLALNDVKISDWEDITDFMNDTKPGETVQLSFERNGQNQTATATLDKQNRPNGQ